MKSGQLTESYKLLTKSCNTKYFKVPIFVSDLTLKLIIMGYLLYVIAVILVIAWLIGFIGFSAGSLIHILLVFAVIAVLIRIIQGRKPL